MSRNAFKGEFHTSKMGAGGHFVKMFCKKMFCVDLKWPEMPMKARYRHPKCPPAAIL